jgi:rsbT co-antagonist protein RsbR
MNDAALARPELGAAHLLELYQLSPEDLQRIRHAGRALGARSAEHVERFYGWMRGLPEFAEFFPAEDKLARVQALQRDYWIDFFRADIDADYIARRLRVGHVHARIGLPLPTYLAAMDRTLEILVELLGECGLDANAHHAACRALTRLVNLDIALVVSAYNERTSQLITEQHEALLEMSTPVTEIWKDILLLPLVGIIDSKRAQDVMGSVLGKISETRARMLILDISGVGVVDTAVANHIIKITRAARLMGCACIISGLSAAIAQTVVELGIEVRDVQTTATLHDALARAFAACGLAISAAGNAGR